MKKYNKLTPEIEKDLRQIVLFITKKLKIDLFNNYRSDLFPKYRSLLNVISLRKHNLSCNEMAKFYAKNGSNIKHTNISLSTAKFHLYTKDYPELLHYFYIFFPEANPENEKGLKFVYTIPKEKKKKTIITKSKHKEINDTYNYFKNELGVDVVVNNSKSSLPKYRSVFNYILHEKTGVMIQDIVRFYQSKGWDKMNNSTISSSIEKLDTYLETTPELNKILDIFINPNKDVKEEIKPTNYIHGLSDIQKLVSNLTEDQEKELIELITLRKKSWLWKNKDNVKIYTAN